MNSSTLPNRKFHRFPKHLLLPAEHGSWAWLLVPFFVGAGIAGQFNLPVWLVLVGGVAAFLLRQPAATYMRVRQGRGQKAYEPLVVRWLVGLGLVAGLSLLGLLAFGRVNLLWLVLPLVGLFVAHLFVGHHRRASTRALWLELSGAAGLAAMAPAAMIAANGRLHSQVWFVWGLMALQNLLGVFYVRLRIADTHQRPSNRQLVLWTHLIGGTAVLLAVVLSIVPPLSLLPFIGFFMRAWWTVVQSHPVDNMKRFGFTEVGVEIVSGLIIIISYYL